MIKQENKKTNEGLLKPSEKAKWVMSLRATLLAVAMAFLVGAVFVFNVMAGVVLAIILLAVHLVYIFVYVPLYYKNYFYEVKDDYIRVISGVFFLRERVLPKSKIDYVMKTQSFFQKKCGVFSLVVYATGTSVIINHVDTMPIKLEERIK